MIGANAVSKNRLGLECCDDMQGPQMGECEVDSHDMSRDLTKDTHFTHSHSELAYTEDARDFEELVQD